MNTLNDYAFLKLVYPDGYEVSVYLSGRVDGVPQGTVVFNGVPAMLLTQLAKQIQRGSPPHSPPLTA